jgi:hypothetical protein
MYVQLLYIIYLKNTIKKFEEREREFVGHTFNRVHVGASIYSVESLYVECTFTHFVDENRKMVERDLTSALYS